ncbi:MAG: protein-L-isoaspartate(D-aspartate) O-methyltransferase [Bacteroidota bacterium]|jgi:protein-L-isoaspartate(D-aspartate) O-methyltransferase|nr:protein-L-isoaspartate(D-aspartate) O-methyltransferase [Bacteroidota bacterium]
MNSGFSHRQFDLARQQLIDLLRKKGISDPAVINAIAVVPRHAFVQEVFQPKAYDDSALPIECRQTISQPFTVAFMTQLLQVRRGDKVLEIGTGSGYQACLLAELGARVFTIERHFDLLEHARRRMETLGYNIASKVGDGTIGWSQFAPFDGIIVTAGAPDVPSSLLRQLADGGRLVIPVGDQATQAMVLVQRHGDEFTQTRHAGFKFVPLVGKEGWRM